MGQSFCLTCREIFRQQFLQGLGLGEGVHEAEVIGLCVTLCGQSEDEGTQDQWHGRTQGKGGPQVVAASQRPGLWLGPGPASPAMLITRGRESPSPKVPGPGPASRAPKSRLTLAPSRLGMLRGREVLKALPARRPAVGLASHLHRSQRPGVEGGQEGSPGWREPRKDAGPSAPLRVLGWAPPAGSPLHLLCVMQWHLLKLEPQA